MYTYVDMKPNKWDKKIMAIILHVLIVLMLLLKGQWEESKVGLIPIFKYGISWWPVFTDTDCCWGFVCLFFSAIALCFVVRYSTEKALFQK